MTAAILQWTSKALQEFGIKAVGRKVPDKMAMECLQSTTPAIKEAAVELACTLYQFIGPDVLERAKAEGVKDQVQIGWGG